MSAQVENKPDLEQLAKDIRGSYVLTGLVRDVVREEMGTRRPGTRRAGLPQSEMRRVIEGIEALRDEMALPADALTEAFEEHRREFRGPLAEEEPDAGAR